MIYLPDTDIYSTMPYRMVRDTSPQTWERDVEGRDGYELGCESVPGTLEARIDPGDPWLDLEANPISLTPFVGTRQRVYFRFTSESFTEDSREDMIVFADIA